MFSASSRENTQAFHSLSFPGSSVLFTGDTAAVSALAPEAGGIRAWGVGAESCRQAAGYLFHALIGALGWLLHLHLCLFVLQSIFQAITVINFLASEWSEGILMRLLKNKDFHSNFLSVKKEQLSLLVLVWFCLGAGMYLNWSSILKLSEQENPLQWSGCWRPVHFSSVKLQHAYC